MTNSPGPNVDGGTAGGAVEGVRHIIDRPLHKCSLLAPSNGLIMHYGGAARPVVAVLIVLIGDTWAGHSSRFHQQPRPSVACH